MPEKERFVIGYLTVVFDPAVSAVERRRHLDLMGNPALPDDSETDAFCVEVPEESLWSWAHRYAVMPGVARVSFTRLAKTPKS